MVFPELWRLGWLGKLCAAATFVMQNMAICSLDRLKICVCLKTWFECQVIEYCEAGSFVGSTMFKKLQVISVKKTFLYQTDFSPRLLSQTEEEGLVQQDRCSLFLSHTPVPQHFRLGLPIGALAILAVSSRHHLLALVSSVKPSKQNTICLQNRFQKICMLCPRERPCLPKDC